MPDVEHLSKLKGVTELDDDRDCPALGMAPVKEVQAGRVLPPNLAGRHAAARIEQRLANEGVFHKVGVPHLRGAAAQRR